MNRLPYALAALLLFLGGSVEATTYQGQLANTNWRNADKCAKQAQAAYPDYSADSNIKRDAKLKECLRSYNLAPRQPLSPPSQ